MFSKENFHLKTLLTFEPKVPYRSNASQNDHKGKGYQAAAFEIDFQKSYFLLKLEMHSTLRGNGV